MRLSGLFIYLFIFMTRLIHANKTQGYLYTSWLLMLFFEIYTQT